MTYGPGKYPSKEVCIYCGRRNVLLTDEHVVPFFIGGKHVISKASCLMCANITKKFEQDVARDLWGEARASYNAPTRRKKERAKSFVLKDPNGIDADLNVLADPAEGRVSPTTHHTARSAHHAVAAIAPAAHHAASEQEQESNDSDNSNDQPVSFFHFVFLL